MKPTDHDLMSMVLQTAAIDMAPEDAQDLTLAELHLDSLQVVELALSFEDRFGLTVDDSQLKSSMTLRQFVDLLIPYQVG